MLAGVRSWGIFSFPSRWGLSLPDAFLNLSEKDDEKMLDLTMNSCTLPVGLSQLKPSQNIGYCFFSWRFKNAVARVTSIKSARITITKLLSWYWVPEANENANPVAGGCMTPSHAWEATHTVRCQVFSHISDFTSNTYLEQQHLPQQQMTPSRIKANLLDHQ